MAENGHLHVEMTHRTQSGWKNWKRVSGVLCDRRISLEVKGKVYTTVVRPTMMYGAETWAGRKQERSWMWQKCFKKMDECSQQAGQN